ncbi:hypothetical protein KIN20_000453 [Parelaphostrongylus tenuis]|uniref:Tetratricopeptide repeat protein n=1 Tax=Parelaphostrongylus tenuis TaxID=148309 RepID=A0AAD5LVH8_PARTN|nr:hypothetical protein KIN20_000453 [Parelaphostrongylus tenuis]
MEWIDSVYMSQERKNMDYKELSIFSNTGTHRSTLGMHAEKGTTLVFVECLNESQRHAICYVQRHHLRLCIMSSDAEAYQVIDELVDDCKFREAYEKLKVLADCVADKAEWHKRCAEVCYLISNMEDKDRDRVHWLKQGRNHALDGHEQNPTSIAILKVLCSTTGRLAEESGVIDKINLGFEFKTYLDRAIAIDPSSFELLHMRGRFSYQVANLNLFERLAARVLGNLPQVSLDAALRDLMEAEQLLPGVTENRLYIGRVLYAKGDYAEAKEWLSKAASATCDDDESVEREHIMNAQKMLQMKVFRQ